MFSQPSLDRINLHRIYYDRALSAASRDPANATVTCRILTIMPATDY
ncbi:DUF3768 domain-containing protein [Rhizorhabdus argentea]